MFFKKKSKGYFIETNALSVMVARTSGAGATLSVEEVAECPAHDLKAIAEMFEQIQGGKSADRFLHAVVGVYPPKRVVRYYALDLKRLKEPEYLNEVMVQQLRIEPAKFMVMLLNARDGSDYDLVKATQKGVLFCGLPTEDLTKQQEQLIATGVYPERLELGSVATLGALTDYLNQAKLKAPTLVLELGLDATSSFIVNAEGVDASRPIPLGLDSMVAGVQKELGLKDEETARKLFYSSEFDFKETAPVLLKRLMKELQSLIGFYEVQTGQTVGRVLITQLPSNLRWIESALAMGLGIEVLKWDAVEWLERHEITIGEGVAQAILEPRWLGLLSLMVRRPLH